MIKKFIKFGVLILAIFAVPFLLPACSGSKGNPAFAPSAPIEVPAPAVLKFVGVKGLTFNLTTLGGASAAINVAKARTVVTDTPDGQLSGLIAAGPQAVGKFDSLFLKPVLQGIEELSIPTIDEATGKPTETFSVMGFEFTHAGTTDYLAGKHDVKISFAAFDIDNKGTGKDCSGNAAITPICVRFWLDNKPFVAGIFKAPPIYGSDPTVPIDIGAGSFRVKVDNFSGTGFDLRFKYDYVQGKETSRESEPPRESREINHYFIADHGGTAAEATWVCGTGCLEFRHHHDITRLGPRKTSQADADSARFAFEEIVSSSPCFAGKATECTCPAGGTITVDASFNFTLNGCTSSSGNVFTGTITPGTDETYNANMSMFGACSDVSWTDAILDEACSGKASGTCAGESWTCSLSLDTKTGACNASCAGDELPILKSINIFEGPIKDNSVSCDFLSHTVNTCEQQTGYIGKYVEDGGYWSGALAFNLIKDGNLLVDLSTDNLYPCVIIPLDAPCYLDDSPMFPGAPENSNCNVPQANCESVGALKDNIFVDDIPYVPIATADDVAFPPESVFPLAPTF